jgi:hypothetical protein
MLVEELPPFGVDVPAPLCICVVPVVPVVDVVPVPPGCAAAGIARSAAMPALAKRSAGLVGLIRMSIVLFVSGLSLSRMTMAAARARSCSARCSFSAHLLC